MGAETPTPDWPALLFVDAIIVAELTVAGDFLTCCGDDLGPSGEKAACRFEYGVEADAPGVAAAYCGVLPCCEGACFMGIGCGVVISEAMGGIRRLVFGR